MMSKLDSILDMLPQKPPFRMVDRILSYHPGKQVEAGFLTSSFFQQPIPSVPITILMEGLAQTGVLYTQLETEPLSEKEFPLLGSIHVHFYEEVEWGEPVHFIIRPERLDSKRAVLNGTIAKGNGLEVASGMLSVAVAQMEGSFAGPPESRESDGCRESCRLVDGKKAEMLLPYHKPWQMIDRYQYRLNAGAITTSKLITASDYYLQGHFPAYSIFPGMLLQEGIHQSLQLLDRVEGRSSFASVRITEVNTRFLLPVEPGEAVLYQLRKETNDAETTVVGQGSISTGLAIKTRVKVRRKEDGGL